MEKALLLKELELMQSLEQIQLVEATVGDYLHQHEFFEIVMFLESGGTHYVNKQAYSVTQGDIWLLPPGSQHYYIHESGDPDAEIRVLNCICYHELTESFFRDLKSSDLGFEMNFFVKGNTLKEPLFLHGGKNYAILEEFDWIGKELREKKEGYILSIKLHLKLLMLNIFRAKIKEDGGERKLSAFDRLRLSKVVAYLKQNYQEKILTKDLCNEFFFSESSLRSKFKLYTNKTIVEFIQEVRIKNACRLLKETEMSIEQIVGEIGFSDKKTFFMLFKKLKNCTPKEYRLRNGNE